MKLVHETVAQLWFYIHHNSIDHLQCARCLRDTALRSMQGDDLTRLFIVFFWCAWIDQVMYWILVDKNNPGATNEHEVYKALRKKFAFPKLVEHATPAHFRPGLFVMDEHITPMINLLNRQNLFTEYQQALWSAVEDWLLSLGRPDLRERAIAAFKEDFGQRVPLELRFLFP